MQLIHGRFLMADSLLYLLWFILFLIKIAEFSKKLTDSALTEQDTFDIEYLRQFEHSYPFSDFEEASER